MEELISMTYGNGGKKTSELIEKIMLPKLKNDELIKLSDGADLKFNSRCVSFSTDSFVIHPYFFNGGDIGKLSVCGTVNDLLMCGSIPKYLSLSLIIEEGFKIAELDRIITSVSETAKNASVRVVTGDTKVVEKGHGSGIYINTAGIGEKIEGIKLGKERLEVGDAVITSGTLGNHGVSILCARENYLENSIESDCTCLNEVVQDILKYGEEIKILRDPTRGGVATTLNEFCEDTDFSIELEEENIPVDKNVQAACSLLGIDPLYSANEGKVLAIVSKEVSEDVLRDLRKSELGKNAAQIGVVMDTMPGKVILKGRFSGRKILDKLSFDMLPRIC